MRSTKLIQSVVVGWATVGMCVPQLAFAAASQAEQKPVISDVRLHESGVLIGQVVTPENRPVAKTKVTLLREDKPLTVATSDDRGYFGFTGLANGVYRLTTPKGQAVYRVWSDATAPPSAHLGALVVDGDTTVFRGQHGFRRFRDLMANPWFVAGVIAAAVAIPVAVHNGHHPSSP